MNTATNTVSFEYSVTREGHFSHPFNGYGEIEVTVRLSAVVVQDSGTYCDSETFVVWTPEADAVLKASGIRDDAEELAGAMERAADAYWDREHDQCRLASARQRQDSARGAA
jgi:hypothetical protein